MKTPVTKEKFQNHIHYSSWKYILLAVLAVFGWNLIYSATAPQTPEEKKVIMGIYAYGEEEDLKAYMEQTRLDLLPDMEDVSAQFIMPDETYGDMILSTRFAARECDIFVLPRSQFQAYADQSAFMALDEVLPDLVADLEAAGVSLSRGYRTNDETGEKHLYGIPCASMTTFQSMTLADMSDMYISVLFETENNDNVLKFTEYFIRDMLAKSGIELPAE